MNRKVIFSTVGRILLIEGALMLFPALVAAIYRESVVFSFLISAGGSGLAGFLLYKLCKPKDSMIFAREGFITVALAWLALSVFGALPFVISGEIPCFTDALFETVSGFTTTGASILPDVEALSHGTLFWRSFTHWVGGMGVLVFIMALFPSESGRTMHIMRAEMPGPIVGKIVPKVRQTARILYLLYIILTAVEMIFLCFGGMSLFESAVHAFGTAGTGGFGIRNNSIGGYSPYLQWVIAIFMMLFGVNFNLYYLAAAGKPGNALKSTELWVYAGIIAVSTALIACNVRASFAGTEETVRAAFFQVSSVMTTTGYSTVNFDLWPQFSRTLLVILMFIGGCAGSTAGGLKVSRIMLMFGMIRQDLRKMLHPRSVGVVRFEGKAVEERTTNGIGIYFALYSILFFAMTLLISFDPFAADFETAFTAVSACFNNIGPGLAAVGPTANFGGFSVPGKLLLSLAMLMGRLEIYPILLAFSPSTWRKK